MILRNFQYWPKFVVSYEKICYHETVVTILLIKLLIRPRIRLCFLLGGALSVSIT